MFRREAFWKLIHIGPRQRRLDDPESDVYLSAYITDDQDRNHVDPHRPPPDRNDSDQA